MKRRAFKLLVFLLAGAIINVAVAWGCALYSGDQISLPARVWVFENPNLIVDPNNANARASYVSIGWTLETLEQTYNIPKQDAIGDTYRQPYRILAGWPSRALFCMLTHDSLSKNRIHSGIGTGLQVVPNTSNRQLQQRKLPRALPLLPIVPGFAINTIFYAAIVWVLFAIRGVPGAMRRGLRHKRGECAACEYSLQGNSGDTCPECGSPRAQQVGKLNRPIVE